MKQRKKPAKADEAKRSMKGAFSIPAALEIVRCNEGGKEFIKEKGYKHDNNARYMLVAEFPLNSSMNEELSTMKRLAKRFARDFLRTTRATAAVVRWNACGACGGKCLQVLDKNIGGWLP